MTEMAGVDEDMNIFNEEQEQFLKLLIDMHDKKMPWSNFLILLGLIKPAEYRTPNKPIQGIHFSGVNHYNSAELKKLMDCDRNDFMFSRTHVSKGMLDIDGVKDLSSSRVGMSALFPGIRIVCIHLESAYASDFLHYLVYLNEIYLLSKKKVISCPYLPKLIGYSIDKVLAVVYDFWPKHCLKQSIHDSVGFVWEDRMMVAIGVARAVKCLHGVGHIVGPIDAHSIFWDEKQNPILCDFSFCNDVKSMLDPDDFSMMILPNMSGHVAPETLEDKWTFDMDVCSFGVLLVELISQQEVGSYDSIPRCVLDLQSDASLVNDSFAVDIRTKAMITKLAMDCLEGDIEKRPQIEVVIDRLEKCSKGIHRSGSPISPNKGKRPKLEVATTQS